MKKLTGLGKFVDSLDDSARMPALFIGHGSPMNALEDNGFVRGFRNIAQTLPKPRAIRSWQRNYKTCFNQLQ